MVIPLLKSSKFFSGTKDLNPQFEIFDESYALLTQELASIPLRLLGRSVENLMAHQDAINRALNILLTRF